MHQTFSRRNLLAGGTALCLASTLPDPKATAQAVSGIPARMRVIIDNDLGGDPDSLFQLAHFALSRSVQIPLVVGSHYKDFGAADLAADKAAVSAAKARELLRYLPKAVRPPVLAGTAHPIQSRLDHSVSPASAAIVREAMRSDATSSLFYAAGGSLTEIALAWLAEPEIAKRLKLVWIGGAEHPDLADLPPGPVEAEYNFSLDRLAAQIVFNESDIEIWQVPRNAFRQMLVGLSELDEMAKIGPLGRYLRDQVVQAEQRLAQNLPGFVFSPGETCMLGDSALVTLTALQSAFQPDSSSSRYVIRPTPLLETDGTYRANPAGRPMRVYNSVDADLTWRDFIAKLRRR